MECKDRAAESAPTVDVRGLLSWRAARPAPIDMRMQLAGTASVLANGLRACGEKRGLATLSYSQTLQKLLTINRERKVNFGVENTQMLLNAVGPSYSPEQYRTIHVAGTNGIFSISLFLSHS